MIRLIFFAVLIAVLVVAGILVVTILLSVFTAKTVMGADNMPSPIQKISYIALVILLIGLSVGWIGGV
ncbi:hypothetical protein [Yoonia sediminilitoris]|uniref:Uncharacterized protein n=1 Tax=Yoonia sediminilitoris TaxID=1286148 RepID=A0A2T6KPY5_9RHOB|nr:hypothetical protein [Yoonia sediminilitoris]PUB18631.1 hypothetical protein C8N45_101215 [Yoonia sediminilitoris]RCW98799.1 hypothetical protein DFP92_101215 [Yoonia sediminilitoris]